MAWVAGPPRSGLSLPGSRAAFSRARPLPTAISRSGPGQVRLASEQYPASVRASPMPPPAPASWSWPAGCGPALAAGPVRLDEGGGLLAFGQHRLERRAAGLAPGLGGPGLRRLQLGFGPL